MGEMHIEWWARSHDYLIYFNEWTAPLMLLTTCTLT